MTWLALDAAGAQAGIAVLAPDGTVPYKAFAPLRPGLIETLPGLLAQAVAGRSVTHIAVGVGPGSFTGLRTALALAQGFAASSGAALWGVPAYWALAQALPSLQRPLWGVLRARRGRMYLLREDAAESFPDEALPLPPGPVALAGDAAAEAAAYLAARGGDILLTNIRGIDPVWVGRAAQARWRDGAAPLPALPLYVDPPEAKLPAAGLRPPPA